MLDDEYAGYVDLLIAIVERAQRDAAGNPGRLDIRPSNIEAARQKVQRDAAAWLEEMTPGLIDLATPDPPPVRRGGRLV